MNLLFMNTTQYNSFNPENGNTLKTLKLLREQIALLYMLIENKKYYKIMSNKKELMQDNKNLKEQLQYLNALINQAS